MRADRAFRQRFCPGEKALASMPMPLRGLIVQPHRRAGDPGAHSAHSSREQNRKSKSQEQRKIKSAARYTLFRRIASAPSARTDARRSTRGPLGRGGWVEESPKDGSHGCEPVFRQHRMCCRKTRNPPAHLEGRMPVRRALGGALSLGKQRKVTRDRRDRKPLTKQQLREIQTSQRNPRRWAPASAGATG